MYVVYVHDINNVYNIYITQILTQDSCGNEPWREEAIVCSKMFKVLGTCWSSPLMRSEFYGLLVLSRKILVKHEFQKTLLLHCVCVCVSIAVACSVCFVCVVCFSSVKVTQLLGHPRLLRPTHHKVIVFEWLI